MLQSEPRSAAAVWTVALGALLIGGGAFAPGVRAQTLLFERGAARSPLLVEVRHRFRHRRHHDEANAEGGEVAQPPGHPKDLAPASPVKEPPPAPQHEVMGPPPPPERWTPAEVQAGRIDCDLRLSGLRALFERLDPIKEGACGSPAPIRLEGFENRRLPALRLDPAATMSCKLAEALHRWFEDVVQPKAKKHLHASVVRISNLSAYQCRSRYNDPDQRISQHAYGDAIDVSEFITAKGERIAVLDHWSGSEERSTFLREIHAGACEIFGTTLGPEANQAHKNHFHLDVKERRRPLCDFTPEQERAREEAARHKPAPDVAAKVAAKGADTPLAPAKTNAPAPPKAAEVQKPEPTSAPGEPAPAHHRRRRHSFRHARF